MSFFQNTCKPEGLGGKLMIHMMNVGHGPMSAWGRSFLRLHGTDVVLDIGCGGGRNLKKLLKMIPYGTATGIDYSPVSVEASKRHNAKAIHKGRCAVLRGDVSALPFDDHAFSAATAFETIYFWPDLSAAFREVHRVLRDGGTFLICNEDDGKTGKSDHWVETIQGMRVYPPEELAALLTDAGFTNIQIHTNEKHYLAITAQA